MHLPGSFFADVQIDLSIIQRSKAKRKNNKIYFTGLYALATLTGRNYFVWRLGI